MVETAGRRIDAPRLSMFRDKFSGDLILPMDDAYDAMRTVWNGMIDRRPAIIVRPLNAADVIAALRFARDEDLIVAVRSGGHSMAGLSTCDDGIVIDLARMRGVTVDPDRRVARCNGGALLGELDEAAQAFGLACNVGTVSHTGIAGLTLGGGMGRLQRKLGLTIDCLRAVELVTADGRLARASADENADLFWGMRGAGPNFGIVTALEFDLDVIGPTISRGLLVYPAERARDVAGVFRDYMPSAPDDVMAALIFGRALPEESYPASIAGRPVATLSITYVGTKADSERVLGPFTALGPPASGAVDQQTYLESQHANDDSNGWGHRIYTKSGYVLVARRPYRRLRRPCCGLATGRGRVLDLGLRWCRRPGSRGGDRVSGSRSAVLGRHGDDVGRPGRRPITSRLGAHRHRPHRALPCGGRLRERCLRDRRRCPGPECLRRREVRTASRAQTGVGSR